MIVCIVSKKFNLINQILLIKVITEIHREIHRGTLREVRKKNELL